MMNIEMLDRINKEIEQMALNNECTLSHYLDVAHLIDEVKRLRGFINKEINIISEGIE